MKQFYGAWLKKRYGSLHKAVSAWGGVKTSGDNPADGKMVLLSAWNMTSDGLKSALLDQ